MTQVSSIRQLKFAGRLRLAANAKRPAALYSAQVTAWLTDRLGSVGSVVIEGPLSRNGVYTAVLAALLPGQAVLLSTDPLEGTARGAWQLLHWANPSPPSAVAANLVASLSLAAYNARWRSSLK